MKKTSWTKLALAVGGSALSLTAGLGIASADTDLSPMINTTCTYPEVVAALNAQPDSAAAAAFNESAMAQSWLKSFLASAPDQRQRMAANIAKSPSLQQYVGVMQTVAATCHG
jgi:hemophore-related protein